MATGPLIVPGKVENNGIRVMDIPDYQPEVPPASVFLPVIHLPTPRGDIGTKFIAVSKFTQRYGDIFNQSSLFYGPNSVLLKNLAAGGQARVGIRRLTMNKKIARVPLSAFIQKKMMPVYQRMSNGQYAVDADGNRIPTGQTIEKIFISIKPDETAKDLEPGELKVREIVGSGDEPTTYVYPMVEWPAGVGDDYNNSGLQLGVRGGVMEQTRISRFVAETGVYPFSLRMFTRLATGGRVYTNTRTGGDTAQMTLFDTEYNDTKYSIKRGVQAFTGRISSTQQELVPTPFSEPTIYQDNIDYIAQLLYSVEKDLNTNLVDKGIYSYRQMNPFTCKDHLGVPYYGVETDNLVLWDLTYAIQAQYGISPFLNDKGEVPDFVTQPTINDPFGLMAGLERPMTQDQAWEIADRLTLEDLTAYVASTEHQNVIVNRQTHWIDVGYSMETKMKGMELLDTRKDIFVQLDATIFKPGYWNPVEDVYSRLSQLTTGARLFPESEKWGTPSIRFSVNEVQALHNTEDIDWPFSYNIELAYAWALAGGNADGVFKVSMSPDHGDYRITATMNSPSIVFQEDLISANSLELGGMTVRPYDELRSYRPALVTGFAGSIDSVVKDQVPVVICINIEKIAQSKWQLVSGDSTITQDNYAAIVKDAIEREVRDNLGGYVRCDVTATYNEAVQGGRAKLSVVAYCSFNKAKYMMEFDLYADNVENLEAA